MTCLPTHTRGPGADDIIPEGCDGPRCQTCGGSGWVQIVSYRNAAGEEWDWPQDKGSPDVTCPDCEGQDD